MHSGLGWVCATRMYRYIGLVEFLKFQIGIFVEWKAPIVYNVKHSVPAAFLRDCILKVGISPPQFMYNVHLMC